MSLHILHNQIQPWYSNRRIHCSSKNLLVELSRETHTVQFTGKVTHAGTRMIRRLAVDTRVCEHTRVLYTRVCANPHVNLHVPTHRILTRMYPTLSQASWVITLVGGALVTCLWSTHYMFLLPCLWTILYVHVALRQNFKRLINSWTF